MQKTISREQVEHIIRNKELILSRIKTNEDYIKERLVDEETIIRGAALPKPTALILYDSVCNSPFRDLYDTIEDYKTISEKVNKKLADKLAEIVEEKKTIHRVFLCFNAIRRSGKYYDVLYEYAVNDMPIEALAAIYRKSATTISVWRRKALDMIVEIYENEEMTIEILENL